MKYLTIENGQGFYCTESNKWIPIDKISKDDLMALLNAAISEDFEMDEYNDEFLKNPAHQIIYKSIYEKFHDLQENKNRFKDECELLYKDAFEKYSKEKS
jgi:hypothetical protein